MTRYRKGAFDVIIIELYIRTTCSLFGKRRSTIFRHQSRFHIFSHRSRFNKDPPCIVMMIWHRCSMRGRCNSVKSRVSSDSVISPKPSTLSALLGFDDCPLGGSTGGFDIDVFNLDNHDIRFC
jgi:hypothetical protein